MMRGEHSKKAAEGDAFDVADTSEMIPQDDAEYKSRIERAAAEFGATVDWYSDVSPDRQMPFWYIDKDKICDIHLDGWLISVLTPNDLTIEPVDDDDITSPEEAYAHGLFVDSDVDGSPEFDWGVNDGFSYACYPPSSDGRDYYLPCDYGWDMPSTLDSVFDFINLGDMMADMESEYESDNPPDDDIEGLPDDGDISESKSKKRRGKRIGATLIKDAGNVEANVAHFNKMMGSAPCSASACGDSTASCVESVAAGDDDFDVVSNISERLSSIGDLIKDNGQSKTPEEINNMTNDVIGDMLSEYGMRIRNVLNTLSSHRELLRADYASSGLVHDSVINGMICREYKKLGIALDDGYGNSTFPKDVLQVDADRHGGNVRLVIRHYWCAAKMYVDGDQFYFDAGSSGVTSPSRDLVKTKYLFLRQFVDTFDILERVVVDAVYDGGSHIDESATATAEAQMNEAPEKHQTLNVKLWNIEDNTLKPEVKEKINAIVKDFCDGLDDNEVKYKLADVRLVGSNCSYNYTDKSDLDIHIVFDLGIYGDEEKEQMAETIYNYARSLWGKTHSVEFYGIPVEVFVETNNTVDLNAADNG